MRALADSFPLAVWLVTSLRDDGMAFTLGTWTAYTGDEAACQLASIRWGDVLVCGIERHTGPFHSAPRPGYTRSEPLVTWVRVKVRTPKTESRPAAVRLVTASLVRIIPGDFINCVHAWADLGVAGWVQCRNCGGLHCEDPDPTIPSAAAEPTMGNVTQVAAEGEPYSVLRRCEACRGLGAVRSAESDAPAVVATCPRCGGTGMHKAPMGDA